jgi:hypothetical protein
MHNYQEHPIPKIITKDRRGIKIEPGLRVAYNHSGDIDMGTILKIVKNEWVKKYNKTAYNRVRKFSHWKLNFELHIENEDGHISKLKNPNSFLII